jgi:hypothetical protein
MGTDPATGPSPLWNVSPCLPEFCARLVHLEPRNRQAGQRRAFLFRSRDLHLFHVASGFRIDHAGMPLEIGARGAAGSPATGPHVVPSPGAQKNFARSLPSSSRFATCSDG